MATNEITTARALMIDFAHTDKGRLSLLDFGSDSFYVWEPPFNDDARFISGIVEGVYKVVRCARREDIDHWVLQDVPGRAGIYLTDNPFKPHQEGSLVIGENLSFTQNEWRVTDRRHALRRLNQVLSGVMEFYLDKHNMIDRPLPLKRFTDPDAIPGPNNLDSE